MSEATEQSISEGIHVEKVILGAMMVDRVAIADATMRLAPDDFSLASHQNIYRAILTLVETNSDVDYVTVCEVLSQKKQLSAVGGRDYIAELTEKLPRKLSVESYVAIVKDKSLLRALISTNEHITNRAADGSEDVRDLIADQYRYLNEITSRSTTGNFYSIHQAITEAYPEGLDAFFAEASNVPGSIATGSVEFDRMTNKLKPGELFIIAGRPSMGKTAWAINIATDAALRQAKIVGVFSLEMTRQALIRRALLSEARIPKSHFDKNQLTRDERSRATNMLGTLMESGMYIDDTPAMTLQEIRAKARRLKQDKGLDLLVIDYMQLMEAGGKSENRVQEVSIISRGLKSVAKELDVPVVCLSQLNRKCEERQDKRPLLSDLRESGSIEQDADLVAFLFRAEYYDRDNPDLKGLAEIILAKQREGPTGIINMIYQGEFARFDDRSYRGEMPNAY